MSKPKFNPNQPYDILEKPKFNPNASFDVLDNGSISKLESGARGAAQGASMGFADELAGTGRAIYEDMKNIVQGNIDPNAKKPIYDENGNVTNPRDLDGNYKQYRDESRAQFKQAQEANPKTYGGTQIAGALATALVPGLGEMNLAKAAGLGAVQGLGDSESESASGLVADTALGAGVGAITHGAFTGLGAGARAFGNSNVGKSIANKAGQATGAIGDAGEWITKKVGKGIFGVDEKATETYLKNSAGVNDAYSLGELADGVLSKTDESSVLNEMRQKITELDNNAWKSLSDKPILSKVDITDAITEYIQSPKSGLIIDGATIGNAQDQAVKRLTNLQGQINALKGSDISESNIKRIIQGLDDNIDWNNTNQKPTNEAMMYLRTNLDKVLKEGNPVYKESMSRVEETIQAQQQIKSMFMNRTNPENYDKFTKQIKYLVNKDDMSGASQAVNKVEEHTGYDLRKDITNSWTKSQFEKGDPNGARKTVLGGVIGGAVGSVAGPIGGAVGAAAGAGMGALTDKYAGPIFKSILNGKLSAQEGIQKIAPYIGKFAKPLADAATKGNNAVAATHYILQQTNPEYRAMLNKINLVDEEK